jgi:putative oxidoreductase
MLVATVKVKLAAGLLGNGQMAGYELDLTLIMLSLFLMTVNQPYSLDHLLFKKEAKGQITI